MAFSTEPMPEAKVKDKVIDPRDKKTLPKDNSYYQWWLAETDQELCAQLLSTTAFLKNFHSTRIRQASLYARLYSGKPLYNYLASTSTLDSSQQMPMGRPTANIVYANTDTLVSMITVDRPKPVFLTDAGSTKEQRLAKEYNQFIAGEFYRCKAYVGGVEIVRDALIFGDGLYKIIKKDKKVQLERTLETELLTDFNDSYYGRPRQLIHTKLCDRGVYADMHPKETDKIYKAVGGTVDNSPQSIDSVSDQFIISEGWHLPSGEGTKDGRHVIVCSEGVILDEPWVHDYFPFEKLSYNSNPVGWFAQGLAEILFPTQMEIYKILIIASQCIEMTGVPKIIISELSKVLETAFNNNVSTIIKTKTMAEAPQFINATSNNPEIYKYIDWLIANGNNMSGVSELASAGEKPAGLNSGEAQREFQNIQSKRFAAFQRKYQDFYPGLANKMMDAASELAKENGKYESVYPGKDGTRTVELDKEGVLKDTYIIQCYDESSLPKDPVGRQAKVSEMLAAGEIDKEEFRELSAFPDLSASDKRAFALRNAILFDLGEIIDKGRKGYREPDEFMLDPSDLGTRLTVQTINEYRNTDLPDQNKQALIQYFTAFQMLKQKASPPPMAAAPPAGPAPLAVAPPAPSISPTSGVAV